MSNPINYRELSEQPGMIMYNGKCSVTKGTAPAVDELVHFIFNTALTEDNLHQAVLVDGDFKILTSKVFLFASVDEFLALANYVMRNGIVVAQ